MPICPRCHSQIPVHTNFCERCSQMPNEQAYESPKMAIEPVLDGTQASATHSFYPAEFIMKEDQLPSDKNLIVDAETIPLQNVTPPLDQPTLSSPLQGNARAEQFTTPEMIAARKEFPWIEQSLPPLPTGPGSLSEALQNSLANGVRANSRSSVAPSHQPFLQEAQQTLNIPQQEQVAHAMHQQPVVSHGLHQQAAPVHTAHHQSGIIHAAHRQPRAAAQQGCRWSCLSNSVVMTVTAVVVIVAVIIGSVWFFSRPVSPPSTTLVTPTLTISGSVIPGQTIAVNGSHFLAGSSLTVTLDGQPIASHDQNTPSSASQHPQAMTLLQLVQPHIPVTGTPVTVAGDGTFSLAVTVPANWSGGSSHMLDVSDANGKSLASQSFTVQASADQTPGSTPTGSAAATAGTVATATSGPTTVPPTPRAGTTATPEPTPTPTSLPAPCITVNPTSMAFNEMAGQGSQDKQTVIISNTCGAGVWSSKADVGWLGVKPANGSINANSQVTIAVSAAMGNPGTFTGNLEFDAELTLGSTIASKVTMPVQLVVAPAPTPMPTATPTPSPTPAPLPANCLQAFPNTILVTSFNPTTTVTIINNCGVAGEITASSQFSWIQANGGHVNAGGTLPVTITGSSLNRRDFGTITFTITTSNGEQQSIQVNVFWRSNPG